MEFITCGIDKIPQQLTKAAIQKLSLNTIEQMKEEIFVIQVIEPKVMLSK
jgi:hypothetical protein